MGGVLTGSMAGTGRRTAPRPEVPPASQAADPLRARVPRSPEPSPVLGPSRGSGAGPATTSTRGRAAVDPDERVETVVQGSFRISGDADLVLATILGSCVAVCLHDPAARLGGMNHFLLPHGRLGPAGGLRYGAHAMELLINALLKAGAQRERLRAKAFGGARMTAGLRDIGGDNVDFARGFLLSERIPLAAESLGGLRARRLRFWPATGRVRMMFVEPQDWQEPPVELAPPPGSGQVDLF